jgi:hypothetical protein
MLAYLRTNDLRPNICHRAEVLYQFALLPFNGACRIGPCFHDSFTTVWLHLKTLHFKTLSISVLQTVLGALRLILAMVLLAHWRRFSDLNGRSCFIPVKTRVAADYILCFIYNNNSFVRVAFLGQPGRLLRFSCLNSVHDWGTCHYCLLTDAH